MTDGVRSGREDAARPLRYPDFIGIGAQKAGTTWLHGALYRHPDLWLPPLKEIHYFNVVDMDRANSRRPGHTVIDTARIEKATRAIANVKAGNKMKPAAKKARLSVLRLLKQRGLTDEWYGKIFAAAPAHARCGEITPEYAMLPEAGFAHILQLNPEVKFLFILRDPIDRAWSQLRMIQRRKSAQSAYAGEVLRAIGQPGFFDRSDYATTIARVRKFVPNERLRVLYFDELVADPIGLLNSAMTFLGVDPAGGRFANVFEARHVGGKEALTPELYARLKELLRPAYLRLQEFGGPIVTGWIERHYSGVP